MKLYYAKFVKYYSDKTISKETSKKQLKVIVSDLAPVQRWLPFLGSSRKARRGAKNLLVGPIASNAGTAGRHLWNFFCTS